MSKLTRIVVQDTTAPTAPSNLTASATATSVTLTWSASFDANGVSAYDVLRGGSLVNSVAGNVLTFTDTTVAPSTAYTYAVRARDAAGNVGASATVNATTPALVLGPEWLIADVAGVDYVYPATFAPGATISTASLWTANGGTPTFSATATLNGASVPITINASTGAITGPDTPGTYLVDVDLADASANDAESDWLVRSTGPGVMWAHDFRSDAEVTTFVDSDTNTQSLWAAPKRIPGAIGNSGALRTMAWATTTTAAVPGPLDGVVAGDTSVIPVADASVFADLYPSTVPLATKRILIGGGSGEQVKLLSVDFVANTVTVQRGFESSVKALASGSRIGQVSSGWNRPLCAFSANVYGTADIGVQKGTETPHRFKLNPGDTNYVEFDPTRYRAFSRFVGGLWGHARHQAQYPTFGGAVSGPGSDTGGHFTDAPWLGDEFYLQFRVKFPRSRFEASSSKLLYIHNVSDSGPQQIYANFPFGSGSADIIPPTGQAYPYYSIGDWQTNGQSGEPGYGEYLSETQTKFPTVQYPTATYPYVFYDRTHPSGSAYTLQWNRSFSGKTAWCWVPDKWHTLLFRIKPGGHNCFPQAFGYLAVEAPASGTTTDQRTEQIVVTNSATNPEYGTCLNAKFPDPLAIKASGPGAGSPWGEYPICLSTQNSQGTSGEHEVMKVMAVADGPGVGQQTLTVMRNWYRDDGQLSTPWAVGRHVWFGPFMQPVPGTSPANARNSIHLTPYKDWEVTLWAHIEGESGYTKLIDKVDYLGLFGGNSGSNDFDRNPPGYNGLLLKYYPNPYVGGNGAPYPTHQDFTQVILSRNFIECPTV